MILIDMMLSKMLMLMMTPVGQLLLGFGGPAGEASGGHGGGGEHVGGVVDRATAIEAMRAQVTPANWGESMLFVVVDVGIVLLTIGMLILFYRIVRGPQLADRVLASDAFSLHVVGLVILLAIRLRTEVFFDAAIVVAIIGFASTLAFAQYIGNRRRKGTPAS